MYSNGCMRKFALFKSETDILLTNLKTDNPQKVRHTKVQKAKKYTHTLT